MKKILFESCRRTVERRKFVPQLYQFTIEPDGKLNEKVWKKAAVFTDLQNTADGRKIQDDTTELFMFFDEKNVYVGIECHEPSGVVSGDVNGPFWDSDSMEISFAGLDGEADDWYRQIVFAVNGIHYSEYIERDEYTLFVNVEKYDYSAKLIIPLSHFGKFNKDSLRFNFYRHRPAIKESHSWMSLKYSNDLDHFGFISIFTPPDEVLHRIWTHNVRYDRAIFAWETAGRCSAKLYIREQGTEKFETIYAGKHALHHAVAENLKSDTTYEYHAGDGNVQRFRTLSRENDNFSFVMTADLHGNRKRFKHILLDEKSQNADMIFLIGDIVSGITGRGIVYDGFLDTLTGLWEKPFYYCRGNHEYRGNSPTSYFEMFAENGKAYQAFSHKGVFFVIIDTDGDVQSDAAYFKDQQKWLKNIVGSSDFQEAEYRILLSHLPLLPVAHGGGKEVRMLMESISEESRNRFDLMLSGHIHQYMKSDPARDTLYSTHSRWKQMRKTENWPFPMLTCEFGGYMYIEKNAESLTVSVISGRDHLLDSVEIPRKK